MSFLTLGWFGSNCPSPPFDAFGQGNYTGMDMYDFSTGDQSSEFPLAIAMKLFWEAQEFLIEATVTGAGEILVNNESQEVIVTRNIARTVLWGGIQGYDSADRAPFSDAKSALCGILQQGGPFIDGGAHTAYKDDSSDETIVNFIIWRRPFLVENRLVAPFEVRALINVSLQSVFPSKAIGTIATQPERLIGETVGTFQELENSCLWVTPWGNVNSPLYGSITGNEGRQFQTTGSMSITVTAADPATRYA
jgi:hypothetical protein